MSSWEENQRKRAEEDEGMKNNKEIEKETEIETNPAICALTNQGFHGFSTVKFRDSIQVEVATYEISMSRSPLLTDEYGVQYEIWMNLSPMQDVFLYRLFCDIYITYIVE